MLKSLLTMAHLVERFLMVPKCSGLVDNRDWFLFCFAKLTTNNETVTFERRKESTYVHALQSQTFFPSFVL